ncbi:TetR/AcrR family transcriptional regulator [Slackia exigua]|uniref:TetR/AcrR family transcriptional regulator n=1 Tax=Slackia exigua TaxID=84109 RepID=UPI0028E38BE7|nr:TetR/AcrR family transcriptional regulator [Slackia exigua]
MTKPPSIDTGRPRENKTSLTRASIAQAALELADEQGIQAVSARKLASRMGKTAMAIYRHFDNIEDVHVSMVELALTEVDASPVPGERWDDTMRRTTRSILDMYKRHENANLLSISGAADSPSMRAHTQRILNLHLAQGMPREVLRKAWGLIDAFLTGFSCGLLLDSRGNASAHDEPWSDMTRNAYDDRSFHDGLEIIVAGIRAIAAPDACEWRTPLD